MMRPENAQTAAAASLPDDTYLPLQWYIDHSHTPGVAIDINLLPVWEGAGGRAYTGHGINVGIFDSLVEGSHPDLAANYDGWLTIDGLNYTNTASAHGTECAGVIAAVADNGLGTTGIAYGATVTSVPISFSGYIITSYLRLAMPHARDFDVVNMSYGSSIPFDNDEDSDAWNTQLQGDYKAAADFGRDGLGTILVAAGGNFRTDRSSADANLSRFQNERHTITVGAVDSTGFVSEYSSGGASYLVCGLTSGGFLSRGVTTTDLTGIYGNNDGTNPVYEPVSVDYTTHFGGTSAAAPEIAAVTALMLEANPGLGWRDVRDILALSARHIGSDIGADPTQAEIVGWQLNASSNVNGAGLHFSNTYGYGLVDATAAVRLAESWTHSRTSANEQTRTADLAAPVAMPSYGETDISFTIASGITAENVTLFLDIHQDNTYGFTITLVAPSGTRSELFSHRGGYSNGQWVPWTFESNAFLGEDPAGTWQVIITNNSSRFDGTLNAATLSVYGDTTTVDNDYLYSNEFGILAGVSTSHVLSDSGGIDTINAAMVSSASLIDLRDGRTGHINGQHLTISAGTIIENATGGDGGDTLTGNAVGNHLMGMRGADRLNGFDGRDVLDGGAGNDVIQGGQGADTLIGGDGVDTVSYAASSARVAINLASGAAAGGDARGDHVEGFENIAGSAFGDSLTGDAGNNNLKGNDGDDLLFGLGGDDHLVGGIGNDGIDGGAGNDLIEGGTGADTLIGGDGSDRVSYATSSVAVAVDLGRVAPSGRQSVHGGDAEGDHISGFENARGSAFDDVLSGDAGNNSLQGNAGDDILWGRDGDDRLEGGTGADTLSGGKGHDIFVFSALDFAATDDVRDFRHGDHIDLRAIDAIAGGSDDAFAFIGEAAFSAAGQVRVWFDGHDTHVEANGVDFSLLLTGVQAAGLSGSDFFL